MNNIIQKHKNFVANQINKGFDNDIEKAKHNVGEVHPNGKWVWTECAPGKFDWRVIKKNSNSGDSVDKFKNNNTDKRSNEDIDEFLKDKFSSNLLRWKDMNGASPLSLENRTKKIFKHFGLNDSVEINKEHNRVSFKVGGKEIRGENYHNLKDSMGVKSGDCVKDMLAYALIKKIS